MGCRDKESRKNKPVFRLNSNTFPIFVPHIFFIIVRLFPLHHTSSQFSIIHSHGPRLTHSTNESPCESAQHSHRLLHSEFPFPILAVGKVPRQVRGAVSLLFWRYLALHCVLGSHILRSCLRNRRCLRLCQHALANVVPAIDFPQPAKTGGAGFCVCAVFVCGVVIRFFERLFDWVGIECDLPGGLFDHDNVDSILFRPSAVVVPYCVFVLHQSDVDVI